MHRVQCAYYRSLITARLDPDGNEISTDEEETIERARAITRRNNPQPFFNLFRPVVRGSSDSPSTSRGDDTAAFETLTPVQLDHANTTQASDTTEGKLEVGMVPRIQRGMDTDNTMSVRSPGSPRSRVNPWLRRQLHQSPANAPSRDDLFSEQKNGAFEI